MVGQSKPNDRLNDLQTPTRAFHNWRVIPMCIAVSALLTGVIVLSGLDWAYFVMVQNLQLFGPLIVADSLGYVFPVLLFAGLFLAAFLAPQKGFGIAGFAVLLSTILALFVSVVLKAFTGRVSPPHHYFGDNLADADNSAGFNLGWMNESILGGWPSSHATIAFACAVTLVFVLPSARRLHLAGLFLATFIGVGVTFGYHWLSEFVSGALIGAGIGLWAGGMMAARMSLARHNNAECDTAQNSHTQR